MNLHPKHVLKKTLESEIAIEEEKERFRANHHDDGEDRMQYFHGESSDFRSLSERDSIEENLDAERSAALPRWLVAASFGGHFGDAGSQMLISSKRLITP
ncbi:hypothetical protein SASPL_137598 [Salvia splendens]|uniref:Uncharacterized protein n=1 Tax=Salvia splendens TaxID=180675 RepID=A0A8X8WVI2_SALSN|nr:hypothetical protein SASPL_137598 [Salvia splendens]